MQNNVLSIYACLIKYSILWCTLHKILRELHGNRLVLQMYCDLVIAVAVLQLYLMQLKKKSVNLHTQMAAIRLHSDQIWCCNKTHHSCAVVVVALQIITGPIVWHRLACCVCVYVRSLYDMTGCSHNVELLLTSITAEGRIFFSRPSIMFAPYIIYSNILVNI